MLGGGGWGSGSRAGSSKQAQTGELQNQDWTIAKRRKEISGSQGSLLGDTGGETIREAVLQRSQSKQDGTAVGIQLRGQNGLSSTTEGSLLPCVLCRESVRFLYRVRSTLVKC